MHAVQCSGGTIQALGDLSQYLGRGCQIINGPLILNNLPSASALPETALIFAFQSVTQITGGLSVINNAYLPTLDCFSNLQVSSIVYLVQNDGLVTAHLPLLSNGSNIGVSNDRHLCAGNYPYGPGNCSVVDIRAIFSLSGVNATQFNSTQQQIVLNLLATAITVTISQVRGTQFEKRNSE